jgi:hypothetical protein
MGDTATTAIETESVVTETTPDGDLRVEDNAVSVWEGRALAAQDQLAAKAHELGLTTIEPSDITSETIYSVEQQIYRAALIRGMRGEELSDLVYRVQQLSRDVQSADGFDPSAIGHAPLSIESAELLPELQPSLVGARWGTVLDVGRLEQCILDAVETTTEVAEIYSHSGRIKQREVEELEQRLLEEELRLGPQLEVVK